MVRPSISYLTTAVLASAGLACAVSLRPLEAQQGSLVEPAAAAGYLSATFLGDVPHVFLHYSQASAPVTFTAVSGSKGELIPTLGTGGARDPYIFQNQVNGKVSLSPLSRESVHNERSYLK